MLAANQQFPDALEFLLMRASQSRCTAEPRQRLYALVNLILDANTRFNLTADDAPELFWPRQIEDSLWAAAMLVEALHIRKDSFSILDVGSGSGIPGLVWKLLWPETKLTLIESRRKRAEWLKQAGFYLNLPDLIVLAGRAETLARDAEYREAFGLVTARALARLSVLLELTLPFVKVGGHVAAIKTADCFEEINEAESALRELGSDPAALRKLPYTRSDGKSCVVLLIQKLHSTPAAYPRKNGLPLKRSL